MRIAIKPLTHFAKGRRVELYYTWEEKVVAFFEKDHLVAFVDLTDFEPTENLDELLTANLSVTEWFGDGDGVTLKPIFDLSAPECAQQFGDVGQISIILMTLDEAFLSDEELAQGETSVIDDPQGRLWVPFTRNLQVFEGLFSYLCVRIG